MNRDVTKCRECGARISFIRTRTYKNIPVEADPVYIFPDPESKEIFIRDDGSTIHGTTAGDAKDTGVIIMAWRQHWSNCPGADRRRKRK